MPGSFSWASVGPTDLPSLGIITLLSCHQQSLTLEDPGRPWGTQIPARVWKISLSSVQLKQDWNFLTRTLQGNENKHQKRGKRPVYKSTGDCSPAQLRSCHRWSELETSGLSFSSAHFLSPPVLPHCPPAWIMANHLATTVPACIHPSLLQTAAKVFFPKLYPVLSTNHSFHFSISPRLSITP